MLNLQQYLLIKIAEEASEVAKQALKTAQFGQQEVKPDQPFTNEERLNNELDDLKACVDLLILNTSFTYFPDPNGIKLKMQAVQNGFEYSRDCGMITENKTMEIYK